MTLCTFVLSLLSHLWIVMAQALESCKDLKKISQISHELEPDQQGRDHEPHGPWAGRAKYPCPTHELIRAWLPSLRLPRGFHGCWSFRTPLAGCGAHAGVLS